MASPTGGGTQIQDLIAKARAQDQGLLDAGLDLLETGLDLLRARGVQNSVPQGRR